MRWFLLLAIISTLSAQQKNIAVIQFDAENISKAEARILSDRLNTELFNTGKYIVIERSQIDEVIKEQGFQQSGCVTSECAVEVGKMLGVDAMVSGSIGKIGSFFTISARMVDVQTGKTLNTVSKDVSGSIDILLTKTMAEIAYQFSTSSEQRPKSDMRSSYPSQDDELYINKEYFYNGAVKSETAYRNEKKVYRVSFWFETGNKKEKGRFTGNGKYVVEERWTKYGRSIPITRNP
jgi:TolB-like protein